MVRAPMPENRPVTTSRAFPVVFDYPRVDLLRKREQAAKQMPISYSIVAFVNRTERQDLEGDILTSRG